MTVTVDELDAMPRAEAAALLASCCGVRAWVDAMVDRRPFGTLDAVLSAADDTWRALGPAEWREMFAHHPRIGETKAATAQDARSHAWSAGEQGQVASSADDVRAQIAAGNRAYEARFGHIYLVSAAGRSPGELLAVLRERMTNDPDTELHVAAAEQAKITRLRLCRLLDEDCPPPPIPS